MTGTPPDDNERLQRRWRAAWIALTALFLLAAGLNVLHVRAGLLTNYLADLVVPAWLYVAVRGLAGHRRDGLMARTFGASPAVAAASIFGGSALSEVSQKLCPHGPFAGTFDLLDIVAYAAGTGVCLLADLRGGGAGEPFDPEASPDEAVAAPRGAGFGADSRGEAEDVDC
jgi:hypothetical protein